MATPPYTIHSQRMRWFIVIMVALAGLFSCATFSRSSARATGPADLSFSASSVPSCLVNISYQHRAPSSGPFPLA